MPHARAKVFTELSRPMRVAHKRFNRGGKRFWIVRWDEQSVMLIGDDLRYTADRRRDNRECGASRLKHCERKRLALRRVDEHIKSAEIKRGILYETEKYGTALQMKISNKTFKFCALRPLANYEQPGVGMMGSDVRECANSVVDAFRGVQFREHANPARHRGMRAEHATRFVARQKRLAGNAVMNNNELSSCSGHPSDVAPYRIAHADSRVGKEYGQPAEKSDAYFRKPRTRCIEFPSVCGEDDKWYVGYSRSKRTESAGFGAVNVDDIRTLGAE
jgi:hypothetical protein